MMNELRTSRLSQSPENRALAQLCVMPRQNRLTYVYDNDIPML